MLARFDDLSETPRNLALDTLQEQMRWAEASLGPEQRQAWLRGVVELYADKPWASELIQRAKQQIASGSPVSDDG
jgi:hypothetical protein